MPFGDLGTIAIPEAVVASDFALMDKYQGFSAELLRLALIGIGAFGFLLEQFTINSLAPSARIAAGCSMALLAISAGFALGHRYMSSDGMFHHLRLLRIALRLGDRIPQAAREKLEQLSDKDRSRRGDRYRVSGYCLGAASISLLLGAIALATFIVVLLGTAPSPRP